MPSLLLDELTIMVGSLPIPRVPLDVRNFPIEPTPRLSVPYTRHQGREDIDHSLHHDFRVGPMKPERHLIGIQKRERTPWGRA